MKRVGFAPVGRAYPPQFRVALPPFPILTFSVCWSIHFDRKGAFRAGGGEPYCPTYTAIFLLTRNGILSDTPRGVTHTVDDYQYGV